jgi:hypothetical protein
MPKRIPFFYWDVHRRINAKNTKLQKTQKERGGQETEVRRQKTEDRIKPFRIHYDF